MSKVGSTVLSKHRRKGVLLLGTARLVAEPFQCAHCAGLTGGRRMWDGMSGHRMSLYRMLLVILLLES